MELLLTIVIIVNITYVLYLMIVVPKFGSNIQVSDDLPTNEHICNKHSGNYHNVISYNHTNKVEVNTWHYGRRKCKSGFMKDFDIETEWNGSLIVLVETDNFNKTLKIQNPDNLEEYKLLIGKWEYRTCGCMVWNWRVV